MENPPYLAKLNDSLIPQMVTIVDISTSLEFISDETVKYQQYTIGITLQNLST